MKEISIDKDLPTPSILRIYHKVEGIWVDKEFTLKRPDFKRAVFDYFENFFKPKAKFSY
ncbi:MAG: hypothetical protein P0S93_03345 [Candidatus Neptunochlamydia sp.]|nr:hypothetical protein [Candidatus Neptunochlamydia sp.]